MTLEGGTVMEDKFNEIKSDQYIRKTEIIVLLRRMRRRYLGEASESEIEASESLSTADEIFGGLINTFETMIHGNVLPIEVGGTMTNTKEWEYLNKR